MCQFFIWHLSRFSGCDKYNSGYYCTKIISFSLSRSDMFSPCMRHLRINIKSCPKSRCGGQQKLKYFNFEQQCCLPLLLTTFSVGLIKFYHPVLIHLNDIRFAVYRLPDCIWTQLKLMFLYIRTEVIVYSSFVHAFLCLSQISLCCCSSWQGTSIVPKWI